MEKFVIRSGSSLRGKVKVSGAKNAVLKLMAASLLTDGKTVLSNVPKIRDVEMMAEVLRTLGAEAKRDSSHQMVIKADQKISFEAPYELVSQMRASIIVLGPLLARLGKARVAMPGGCNIGTRKIDLHIRGLEMLGATIELGHGYIEAQADSLKGNTIVLDFPSVGATENLLMAATLAKGTTIIENVAREPEVVDLAEFLSQMGAKIEGAGSTTIEIEGVDRLKGVDYAAVPDRIEAGTFLVAGAVTAGKVTVQGARADYLSLLISKLKEAGVEVRERPGGVEVSSSGHFKPVDVATLPYPGFPTDMQAQMMVPLSLAKGTSVITENVFENRFMFIDELNRMGANIRLEGHHAVVKGVKKLTGAPVRTPDLRAGAALVLAGLVAEGVTEVYDIYHIDRGYENFEAKLAHLGADIKRVEESTSASQVGLRSL